MFKITGGKGFQITFKNGCTLSVQFGPGNYSDKRDAPWDAPKAAHFWKSTTAEVAIILPNGDFYQLPGGDPDVAGWQTVEDVIPLIDVARNIDTSGYPEKDWSANDDD